MSYLFTTQRTTSPLHRIDRVMPRLTAKQFKVYLSLRKVGVKPSVALDIVFEWFNEQGV